MIFICSIIKDEHLFIREWVQYHFRLGIDQIVLYDNNSSRDYQEELGDLDGVQICPWITDDQYRQRYAYEHFQNLHNWRDEDWCFFIDADEFIHLERYANVQELVGDYFDYAGVVLSWKCFGANGYIKRPSLSVRAAYTKPAELIRPNHNFKSLARINEISMWNDVHRFTPFNRKVVNVKKELVVGSNVPQVLAIAWIDHYITKSWEDYVARLKRGNISWGIRSPDHFYLYNPDMEHLIDKLTIDLNYDEFPTIYRKDEKEALEREEHLGEIANRLEAATTQGDATFNQFCAIELVELSHWYLERAREEDRQRLGRKYINLVKIQLAAFSKVPRSIENYHSSIISNLISTPFERIKV